jgi:Putative transposase
MASAGLVPPGLLPARARALAAVPPAVPGEARGGACGRPPALLRRAHAARRAPCLRCLSGAVTQARVGRLCQATLRRTSSRARLPQPLHPPRRHRQQPPRRLRRRRRHLPLASGEFIRRFLIHVLPSGFHRIRHYGLFANGERAENLARVRDPLGLQAQQDQPGDADARVDEPPTSLLPCPGCGGRMIIIETFERASTPMTRPSSPSRIDTS